MTQEFDGSLDHTHIWPFALTRKELRTVFEDCQSHYIARTVDCHGHERLYIDGKRVNGDPQPSEETT